MTSSHRGKASPTVTASAADVPPGAHRLLFLPFLMGERGARGGGAPGASIGLTTERRRGDLVRAVLEGVAFELRRLLEGRDADTGPESLILKGGRARSQLWCEIVSGVFGLPYRTTHRDAAYGAALTAGVSPGWWTDWQSVPPIDDELHDAGLGAADILDDRYLSYCAAVDALA